MAAGAAGVACQVREMHRNMMLRFSDWLTLPPGVKGRLARNEAIDLVADGLIAAWKYYGKPVSEHLQTVELAHVF